MKNSMSHGVVVIIVEIRTEDSHSFDVMVAMIGEFCDFNSLGISVRFMIVVFVSGSSTVSFARSMVLLKRSSCLILTFEWCLVALILKFGVVNEHEWSRRSATVYFPGW